VFLRLSTQTVQLLVRSLVPLRSECIRMVTTRQAGADQLFGSYPSRAGSLIVPDIAPRPDLAWRSRRAIILRPATSLKLQAATTLKSAGLKNEDTLRMLELNPPRVPRRWPFDNSGAKLSTWTDRLDNVDRGLVVGNGLLA
jgi:hypothetical protein